ncbi:hypothetical protein BE11_18165 [Sorangium cellulosum]|nr:hypothetical protein BE11_18165 [Sorangium cellulosum]
MIFRAILASIALLCTSTLACEAAAECAAIGEVNPSDSELAQWRKGLATLRRQADVAARASYDIGQDGTGRELGDLGTLAVNANAASYDPQFSCQDIVKYKAKIHEAMQSVHERAARPPRMSERDRNRILGPVDDAIEDLLGSAGTPSLLPRPRVE